MIHIFTHDSIGVGEDGPTHQPIEQLASLRAIPGLIVMRPGDANEVVEAWRVIMKLKHEPVGPDPDAAGDARRSTARSMRRHGRGTRAPMCWPTPPDGKPDVLLLGHRQRSLAVRGGVREAEGGGHQGARGEHAVAGSCSSISRRRIATACCRRPSRRGSAWSRPPPSAGRGMSG